ncbi:SPOR domain-containing protein [Aquimonas voraii]|uniref:Sporulation related domain-containing protein n=1 Tax=Aquimonas voraii TaxID=265719 RepID=A0A1G6Z4S0_9GAMM|nr:SPOR domain-containing protein [Aquimonas voraii]SDD97283.1 Sporulation related domain-containing protein [Aquimonas voraii]
MAARRGKPKSQARRGNDNRVPGWAWLLAGVLLGLGIAAFVLYREGFSGKPGGPTPNPTATPPATSSEPAVAPPLAETPKRPRYDFYTLLREQETAVSDRELAERARAEAEAAAKQRAQQQQQQAQQQTEATASAPRERYQLQAGAFRDAADAEALKARLALVGQFARVQTDTINGGVWHRVRLGPYSSPGEAEAAKRALAANGIDAIAVRESGQ